MLRPSLTPQTIPGSRVNVIFAEGALDELGEAAKSLGAARVLLVTDPGIREAGHEERAVRSLYKSSLVLRVFDDVEENPTALVVGKALRVAREFKPDFIVGLGGGSSMDCAKGVNFLYTNGGKMQDYLGTGKATQPMLPMIAVPTTAGTGSEAQSYALISDPETHVKMACGDPKALPKLAILDPQVTATCPPKVAAATGIDAVAHAVETAGSARRNDVSRELSRQAWMLLSRAYEEAITHSADALARSDMLLGAHYAGCAIENSMLGAAHALANPITAKFGVTHGVIVGLMLPQVVRFNCADGANPYADLSLEPQSLAKRIEAFLDAAKLPRRLSDVDVPTSALPELATLAAKQWTASFNPRPVGEIELLSIYQMAANT